MNDRFLTSSVTAETVQHASTFALIDGFEARIAELESSIQAAQAFREAHTAYDAELKAMRKIVKRLKKLDAELDAIFDADTANNG